MNQPLVLQFASRLMGHPAAPYHEHAVRAEAEAICAEQGLAARRDQFGNVLVSLRTAPGRRPLVLAAHLDHPGFELIRRLSPQGFLARFRGGVADEYFRPGTRLRLMPGAVAARLGRRTGKEKLFEVEAAEAPVSAPAFAVWELEDFALRGKRIVGRACDDLIGVATILAVLSELKRSRARVQVLGVLSRAEEVGFQGALAAAAARTVPGDALVISLETSRELPGGKMGQGVILRVGDKASVFDSEATRFLAEVAAGLKAKNQAFPFQRALMAGGTCEATAYQELGYQSAAVCVALGNYHNCGPGTRIGPEYVSLEDVATMVSLLVAASREMPRYKLLAGRLPKRLQKLLREARTRLQRSA